MDTFRITEVTQYVSRSVAQPGQGRHTVTPIVKDTIAARREARVEQRALGAGRRQPPPLSGMEYALAVNAPRSLTSIGPGR
jgi:hypothetical protein